MARFALLARSRLHGNRHEIALLLRDVPVCERYVAHHNPLDLAFRLSAARYLIGQLDRAANLYLMTRSLDGPRRQTPPAAPLLAFQFLQHQSAWNAFCRWLHVPPEFAFWPSFTCAPPLRAAEGIARRRASTPKQAQAAAPDQPAKRLDDDDILAQWKKDFDGWAEWYGEQEEYEYEDDEEDQKSSPAIPTLSRTSMPPILRRTPDARARPLAAFGAVLLPFHRVARRTQDGESLRWESTVDFDIPSL